MTNPFTPPGPTPGPPAPYTPPPAAGTSHQPQWPPYQAQWPQQPNPPRKRWSTRRPWAVGVGVTVLCVALVAGPTWGLTKVVRAVASSDFGCDSRDAALAPGLAELPAMRMRPPRTEFAQAPSSDCDVDTGYATADRSFESKSGPADVLAYYRKELPAAGWTAVPESSDDQYDDCEEFDDCEEYDGGGPEGITCFSREVNGATAFLSVYFPEEDGRNTTMYGLAVSATYSDPDLGC